MVENPVDGQLYWSIKQSMESELYGDYSCIEPWLGKLHIDGKFCLLLRRVDSNATAIVQEEDLFLSERKAAEEYVKEEFKNIMNQIDSLNERRKRYSKFIEENHL